MRIMHKYKQHFGDYYKDIEIMQIQTEENRKEIKQHGTFAFPVNVSVEAIHAYEQGIFLWHWHPEIELTWVMSGEMIYHVNDATYHLSAGDGMFGNSNALHSGQQIDDRPCTYLTITFLPVFLYGYAGSCLQTDYVDFITKNDRWASLKLQRDIDWHREIFQEMNTIYQLSLKPPQDYELQVQILLMQIWQKLYRYFSSLPEQSGHIQKNVERLRIMIAYMQEHYAQDIRLTDIAASVNICKSECCRFFKKHMNMTIFDYLMYLRIHNSLPLLRQGVSVTQAAGMVGFSSAAYYGQIFKRYMKCTPREYRQQSRDS